MGADTTFLLCVDTPLEARTNGPGLEGQRKCLAGQAEACFQSFAHWRHAFEQGHVELVPRRIRLIGLKLAGY